MTITTMTTTIIIYCEPFNIHTWPLRPYKWIVLTGGWQLKVYKSILAVGCMVVAGLVVVVDPSNNNNNNNNNNNSNNNDN